MRVELLRKTLTYSLPLIFLFQSGCGFLDSSYDSNLLAVVGSKPVVLPGKIEAENFNAAVDNTAGNSGTECTPRNNPDVDVQPSQDDGGGCIVGWTEEGEVIDYYVLNRSSEARKFDIEFRLASGDVNSALVVETPAGTRVGEVSAIGQGYTPGWFNWVNRKLSGVTVKPGLQIVRVKFKGGNNFNWLNVTGGGAAGGANLVAENAMKRSCAGCHAYMQSGSELNWSEIARRAAPIKARLADKVSPMPPKGVDQNLQISEEERSQISAFVSGIADSPLAALPIASREFQSKGMNLVRETMAQGAGHIWGMIFLPDGNILCSLKTGEVKIFNVETRKFTTISGGPKAAQHGQGGLLDVGISPDFGDDNLVYFSYAKDLGNGQFTTALSRGRLDGTSIKDLKEIFVATGSNGRGEHFGGRLVIDSDHSIWLGIGERNDRANAQRLDLHLGKILHLTQEGKAHPGNPFINGGGLPEIYSYGHRNPQGLTKNKLTGEIWESEHGPQGGDEINKLVKGANFGWPIATYGEEYGGGPIGSFEVPGTVQPMNWWVPSIAPSGLQVYDSDLMPAWKGLAISGALVQQHINLVEIKDGKKVSEERLFREDNLRVREVEQSPSGQLWYAADTGQLFRIRPR